jgi:dipeptidyl aminopeptidase/acylaminoacyl peptidase
MHSAFPFASLAVVAFAVCGPVSLAQSSAAPAEPHYPTTEDLRHLKSINSPLLSPDGKLVVFSVAEATADGGKTHFWLASTAAGSDKARQITFATPSDKRGERSAQWAPDSTAIYFLAKRGEQTQLFRLDLRGGDASPYDFKTLPAADESKIPGAIPPADADNLTANDESSDKPAAPAKKPEKKPEAAPEPLPLDIGGYAPSEDGKWLAVWARDPETPGEKKQKDAKADATRVNHEFHGTRLYLAALKSDGSVDGPLKSVAIPPDVGGAVWSPLANTLFVIAEEPNDASDLGPAGAGWVVDVATPDKPRRLTAIPPTVGRTAAWTADGQSLVFAAQTPDDAPPGYENLFVLPIESSAPPRRLAAGFNGQIDGVLIPENQGASLIVEAAIGTRLAPVRLSLDDHTPATPLDLGVPVAASLATNRKQTGWVWLADGGGIPQKLCYAARLGDACQSLSTPTLAPADLRSVKPELVKWTNGAMTIEGLLYMPEGASAKVPLVVDVHGGPFGAFEDRNDPFAAFLVGQGWAILRPNPRGSSNYGAKFAAANKNDLGGGDYLDVMAGVDFALAHYPLDPNRMTLMGYSYGGEMAGFVEGKTDRFKAIVSGAPVIDQFSEYGTEGGSWYDRWYFGKPWEHLEDAWKQSPLAGAAHAKTPFMLLQGEGDTTDPLGQSQEMYRALRQEGVPVELVTYPRDNHGPLAIGMFGRPSSEPWHGLDARRRVVDFIEKAFASAALKP